MTVPVRRALLAVALLVAAARAQDVTSPDPAVRARAYVALALSPKLEADATPVLVSALDDRDPTAKLAASIAVCHSPAAPETVYIYALGNVHTSIRPQITNSHTNDNWVFAPEQALQAIEGYLPVELPAGALARLKASATSPNILQRDPAEFLLAADARRSAPLAREVDALIFGGKHHPAIRMELAIACLTRLGPAAVPVLADGIASGQAFPPAVELGFTRLIATPGGPGALARLLVDARPAVAETIAQALVKGSQDHPEARAALEAARSLDLSPAVRAILQGQ